MGLHLGKALSKVAGAAVGTFVGGPAGSLYGAENGLSGAKDWSGITGFDFVKGAVGLGQDAADAEMNLYYRKKAADYAYKQNLNMWNLQNAYNDPSAQMARLQAAGLNPNLVYGGGNVTGNAASSGPEYKLDGNVYQNKSIQREQLQLALAEHHQRITNQSIENELARQRLGLAEREADRSDALAQAQIQAMKSSMGYQQANIDNFGFNQAYQNRKFAFEKYKTDLASYEKLVSDFRSNHRNWSREDVERSIQQSYGRRPMLMDYLPGGMKYKNY